MSFFVTREDGYYALTTAGIVTLIVIILLLVVLTAFIRTRKKEDLYTIKRETVRKKKKLFSTRQLVFSAMALALGFVTSYIKIVHMPWGGSITLCSMLFIVLVGYWYGPKIGLITGLAYGILQFVQGGGSYILSPLQACLDYIVAFMALGLSGFFYKSKNGLLKGYILAILVRGLIHSIGGYLYWMDYMPESFPSKLSFIYPFAYNYSYILAEGIITVVILLLPPVKKAMGRVKALALQD